MNSCDVAAAVLSMLTMDLSNLIFAPSVSINCFFLNCFLLSYRWFRFFVVWHKYWWKSEFGQTSILSVFLFSPNLSPLLFNALLFTRFQIDYRIKLAASCKCNSSLGSAACELSLGYVPVDVDVVNEKKNGLWMTDGRLINDLWEMSKTKETLEKRLDNKEISPLRVNGMGSD